MIAIIAILASMLLPALSKARAAAQAIRCVGNLKQLGVMAALYTSDSNDFLPIEIYTPTDFYAATALITVYGNNMSPASAICPTQNPMTYDSKDPLWRYWTYGAFWSPWDWNQAPHVFPVAGGQKLLSHVSTIRKPTAYPYLFDSVRGVTDQQSGLCTTSTGPGIHLRHNNRANILYIDGHAAAANLTESNDAMRAMCKGVIICKVYSQFDLANPTTEVLSGTYDK